MRGVHPRSNLPLPYGLDEQGDPFCPTSRSNGVYVNAIGSRPKQRDSVTGMQPPLPCTLMPRTATAGITTTAEGEGGKTARQNMQDMLARVRMKEAVAVAHRGSIGVAAKVPAAPIEVEAAEPPSKLARRESQPASVEQTVGLTRTEVGEPLTHARRRCRFKPPG